MQVLSTDDLIKVQGGFWILVVGSIVGLTSYAFNQYRYQEEMTIPGAASAMCTVTIGYGGVCASAAAVGIVVENVAWRFGLAAINAAGQAIASEYDKYTSGIYNENIE